MNIQIFGTTKCFDTKKAQRYFKERGIKFQMIDLKEKGMSRGEFDCWRGSSTGRKRISCLRTSSCCAPPSCATAARPPWATSPMCGRTGSNRAVGFSQKNHGQGFALCAALWYTESQQ